MKTRDVEQYLRKAKEAIKDEKDWYPGPGSGRRCAIEALANVPGIPGELILPGYGYLNRASVELGFADVIDLNDNTNHTTVLKMYDLAITQISNADNG